MFKTKIALALMLFSSVSLAAEYYVVVPLPGGQATTPTQEGNNQIQLSLAQVVLPPATEGAAYTPVDFMPMLQVTGDAEFDASQVSWQLAGELPQGLVFAGGQLSGTPLASVLEGSIDLVLTASYKGASATQQYLLTIDPAPSFVGDGVSKAGACASGAVINCATWDPASITTSNLVLSANKLKVASTTKGFGSVRATVAKSSGKWYWEYRVAATGSNNALGGVANAVTTLYPGHTTAGAYGIGYSALSGHGYKNAFNIENGAKGGAPYSAADVIGVASDMDSNTVTFYKNGVKQFSAITSHEIAFYASAAPYDLNNAISANFGQQNFAYPVPAGYNMGLW